MPFAVPGRGVPLARARRRRNRMDTIWWVVIAAVAAVVLVAIAAQAYAQSRRRSGLREQFGPEYDRIVGAAGSRRKAEQELAERERARESLDIRPLTDDAR